jgi:pimeloyl-ACP methyl ester carboxylesterase
MIDRRGQMRRPWVLIFTLLAWFAALHSAVADVANDLRVTDYFVTHTSNEPSYAQQSLDPGVLLHLREVVLAGRERTVARDGRALLLIHGYSIPGYVAFDTDHGDCSLMRHFARAGWDTFALDLEGYGLSTRPPVMDDPAAFPDSKAPIRADVTLSDVDRVVDFIGALRGIRQVHLLGWSLGASVEAPRYALAHPEKVAKLVLFAVSYQNTVSTEERERLVAEGDADKVWYSAPTPERWARLGTEQEFIAPGCFDAHLPALLASDPKAGALGGVVRIPAGRSVDEALAAPRFDAGRITMPTLVVRGAAYAYAGRDDNQELMNGLGSAVKNYLEIPNAGHFLQFENVNLQFYEAVLDFLEAD